MCNLLQQKAHSVTETFIYVVIYYKSLCQQQHCLYYIIYSVMLHKLNCLCYTLLHYDTIQKIFQNVLYAVHITSHVVVCKWQIKTKNQ